MLLLAVLKELSVIGVIVFPLEFGSRQYNMASNLLWVALLVLPLQQSVATCSTAASTLTFGICFFHIFICFLGAVLNVFQSCAGKRSGGGQSFRFFVLIGTVVMAALWVYDLSVKSAPVSMQQGAQCYRYAWVASAYFYASPIAILSMLLILCTVRSDYGDDVRSKLMEERNKQIEKDDYLKLAVAQKGGANDSITPLTSSHAVTADKQGVAAPAPTP